MLMTKIATTVRSIAELPQDGYDKRFGRGVRSGEIWYTHASKSIHQWDGQSWVDKGTVAHQLSDGRISWKWP